MITADQIRAARGILNLTQDEFAKLCGLSYLTIYRYERQEGEINALTKTLRKIKIALDEQGIVLVPGGAYRAQKKHAAPQLAQAS